MLNRSLFDTNTHRWALLVFGLLIILVLLGQRYSLLQSRFFDNDEFEHMHSAWLISNGSLPYIDYFEHHTPAMHFLIAPFFSWFEVETKPAEATSMLIFTRKLMWVFSGIILLATFWLGKSWKDWRTGLIGTIFLVCTVMFQEKTIEIRPDLLSLPCWLGCLVLLIKVVQPNSLSTSQRRWLIAICGFLLGFSILCTQKMLFAMPGFTLAMFVFWFSNASVGTFQERFILILCQLGGFFLPMVLMLGYFQIYEGAYAFIEYNLLLNLGWKAGFSPEKYINQLMEQNPFLVGFGLLGMIWSVTKSLSLESFKRGDYILIINLVGLLVGLFIIPVPWRQYYLIFLPLLALFASSFLINTVNIFADTIRDLPSKRKSLIGYGLLFLILTGVLTWFTIPGDRAISTSMILKKAITMAIIVCGLIPLFFQKRDLAIIILIAAVHLPVVKKFANKYKVDNGEQLANIHYVIENSPPDALFMDGWQGIGVFRQHAYFYWMLHEEVRGMLSQDQIDQLLTGLRSGEISPYFINLDEHLIAISPELTQFVQINYEKVGVAYLYKEKTYR